MVLVDTSAWIEYFNGKNTAAARDVDHCLEHELVGIGDLVYCEVIQGIRSKRERDTVSSLLLSLPRFELAGFKIAQRAADNYRRLRQKGISVRKTIDVIIGTFCAVHGLPLIHKDRDFDLMADHIGLILYKPDGKK